MSCLTARRKVWGDQKRAKHQNVVNIMTLHTDKDLKPNNLSGKILNQSRKIFGLKKAYFLWKSRSVLDPTA